MKTCEVSGVRCPADESDMFEFYRGRNTQYATRCARTCLTLRT